MRTVTNVQQVEAPSSFADCFDILGDPAPALAGRIPQTLRGHVSARPFGDFGTVLLAQKPASSDLSDRVVRWRAGDVRGDLPLRAHSDQSADDRRLRFAISVTAVVFSGWIIVGVIAAALSGKL
ncbi:MAG: hypothetical protein DI640_01365 [Sphingomonas taxi]|uniref:Uncharacterized protein n=1 Tax=Sphingomonas taxi TaxID=1549858 RepID=A0A2W4ZAV9_9SPHN|nr:MAG: hypothetical protein DI640_01365 [Sphingomonas taxi]